MIPNANNATAARANPAGSGAEEFVTCVLGLTTRKSWALGLYRRVTTKSFGVATEVAADNHDCAKLTEATDEIGRAHV